MTVNDQSWDVQVIVHGEPPERKTLEEELEELFDMFLGLFVKILI